MDELWQDLTPSSLLHSSTTVKPPLTTTELVFQELLPTAHDHFSNAQTHHELPCSGKKRCVDENVVEKRKKRLMKNRESAVRSRARRQAYTYELEDKVAHLVEQNDKIREHLEQFRVAADDGEEEKEKHPKNHRLNRTLSCPF